MRVALVSPYSWTYPGGVARHVEALARELDRTGHDVKVLAPFDLDRRRTALLHRGARPQVRDVPDWLIPLGGTIGWPFNGAVSNVAGHPSAVSKLRRELRAGQFDVVHIQEPVAPVVGWDALTSADAPLVGTFHCYSETPPAHKIAALLGARRKLNHLQVRIAVSEAAAWTGKRFYGGRYRVIPNGVVLPEGGAPPPRRRAPGEPLRIAFVGQAVERKGLPVLLRAFEALRREVPAELVVIGSTAEELAPLLVEADGVTALGRIDDAEKERALRESDLLCAPSLGGESFGMVLTEAFAAGTPVVASDIAGYRDVVADGVDGLLVPRGDATRLAETLRDLALEPARVEQLAANAATSAERYAWPRVAEQVVEAYGDARAVPRPERAVERAAIKVGVRTADGQPRVGARRLPSLDPLPAGVRRGRFARRAVLGAAGAGDGGGLGAGGAAHRAGPDRRLARALEPGLGAVRPGADVRLDAAARRLLARDPEGRAARRPAADRRRRPGHDDRRADVGDAAGPARRAVARARGRAPARPRARPLAGRARDDRLPDAFERARARDPRRRDVHHDRALRRPPAGAAVVRARADRRALRGARRARADPFRAPVALGARRALGRARAATRWRSCAPAWWSSCARARARWRSRCSSRRGRCSGSPATCCWSRSGSRTKPISARRPPCCSRSTSPPCCR